MIDLFAGICQYGTILLALVAWQSSQTAAYLPCTRPKLLEGVPSVELSLLHGVSLFLCICGCCCMLNPTLVYLGLQPRRALHVTNANLSLTLGCTSNIQVFLANEVHALTCMHLRLCQCVADPLCI